MNKTNGADMRLFALFVALLMLQSCAGGASQSQLNSAMNRAEQAAANCSVMAMPTELSMAWEKVAKLDEQQCPQTSSLELSSAERLEKTNCWKSLVKDHVVPVSSHKKDLNKFLTAQTKIGEDYSKDKIDRNTAQALSQKSWGEYAASEVSYYNLAQCQNAALQQHLMPVYHNKGLLADFMVKRSEIALKADQGKLTRQQADLEVQKAFAQFTASEQSANAAIQAQNAQAWRDYAAGMRQVSQQMTQAEAAQQRSMGGGIKNTNCQFIGNQMQCTNW